MSVMLYPCMLCVALLMCLFVLCVACLAVFVNCLVDHHLYLVKSKSTCPRRVLLRAAQHLTTLQVMLNVNDTMELCGKVFVLH